MNKDNICINCKFYKNLEYKRSWDTDGECYALPPQVISSSSSKFEHGRGEIVTSDSFSLRPEVKATDFCSLFKKKGKLDEDNNRANRTSL